MEQVWRTDDGKVFDSQADAEEYEASLISKQQELFERFCKGYSGKCLLEKYDWNTYGVWKVEGEDRNCDFAGARQIPHIAYLRGELEDVVWAAVTCDKFWCWGAGGNIEKVEIIDAENFNG